LLQNKQTKKREFQREEKAQVIEGIKKNEQRYQGDPDWWKDILDIYKTILARKLLLNQKNCA